MKIKSSFTVLVTFILLSLVALGCKSRSSAPLDWSSVQVKDKVFLQMASDTSAFALEKDVDDMRYNYPYVQAMRIPADWRKSMTIAKLADFYNFMAVIHPVKTDGDAIYRFESQEFVRDARFDTMNLAVIQDPFLQSCAKEFIQETMTLLKHEFLDAPDGQSEAVVQKFDKETRRILDTAYAYAVNEKWLLDYDVVEAMADTVINPEIWVPGCYSTYSGKDAHPTSEQINTLYAQMITESDLNKKVAELFTLAGCRDLGRDSVLVVLHEMERAMESGAYCPMMHLLWRAYRVLYNSTFAGSSSWDYSPNLRYNHYRRLVAYNYLNHLSQHPEDKLTHTLFIQLLAKEDILRFGDYPFGNQAEAEYVILFWNKDLL